MSDTMDLYVPDPDGDLFVFQRGESRAVVSRAIIEQYVNHPYTEAFHWVDGQGYIARIKEFPGCVASGREIWDTQANLREAEMLWIANALMDGREIPTPEINIDRQTTFAEWLVAFCGIIVFLSFIYLLGCVGQKIICPALM